MRRHDQFSPNRAWIAHPHAKELEAINRILDGNPAIAEAVAEAVTVDLVRGMKNPKIGSRGMSGSTPSVSTIGRPSPPEPPDADSTGDRYTQYGVAPAAHVDVAGRADAASLAGVGDKQPAGFARPR
jgi:hypothetical protein